jgi:hypothetical protein
MWLLTNVNEYGQNILAHPTIFLACKTVLEPEDRPLRTNQFAECNDYQESRVKTEIF